jgi:hypothetical protein
MDSIFSRNRLCGQGFGWGAVLILDSSMYGQTLLGVTGDLTATLGFIGGLPCRSIWAEA